MNLERIFAAIEAAEEHYDACPVCGEDFVDVDAIKANGGTLVFIHDDRGVFVDGCERNIAVSEIDV